MNTQEKDFNMITEFVDDLFDEIGVKETMDGYEKLRIAIEDRVIARVFLELVNSLTPQQAKLVANDLVDTEHQNPDAIFAKLIKEIPDLQGIVVQILAKIRLELISDLKEISTATEAGQR